MYYELPFLCGQLVVGTLLDFRFGPCKDEEHDKGEKIWVRAEAAVAHLWFDFGHIWKIGVLKIRLCLERYWEFQFKK